MEIENGKAKLNEMQTILVAGLLQGVLLGYNDKIRSDVYIAKEERELIDDVVEMVQQFEDNDIL